VVPRFLAAALLLSLFLLITVIDVEHHLILHVVSLPAAIALGVIGIFSPGRGPVVTLLGGLGGFGIALGLWLAAQALAALLSRLRRRPLRETPFGGGDVTLAGVVGLSVGWPDVITALLITALANGAFGLIYLVLQLVRGRYRPFTPLPFGPFLALGALIVYFRAESAFP
jgi:leader peptidase (prepilin peptidase)/N-methyltransferase